MKQWSAALIEVAPGQQLAGSAELQSEREAVRVELQRMLSALTRTRPSRRSCEVRLALAEWLHRRLRRGGLHTNQWVHEHYLYAYSLLHRFRLQVALLRSILPRQLSDAGGSDGIDGDSISRCAAV